MSSKHVFLVATASFALCAGFVACSEDENRPPAASSGGSYNGTSSGAGTSSGSADGSTDGSPDGSTSSSSGSSGLDSGFIQTGLRASIDGTSTAFETTPTAVRSVNGDVVTISGRDGANGNKLDLTLTSTSGAVTAGSYNCTGAVGAKYGAISYTAAGGAETWNAQASGECTIELISIDITVAMGRFTANAKRDGSPAKAITSGEFRLLF